MWGRRGPTHRARPRLRAALAFCISGEGKGSADKFANSPKRETRRSSVLQLVDGGWDALSPQPQSPPLLPLAPASRGPSCHPPQAVQVTVLSSGVLRGSGGCTEAGLGSGWGAFAWVAGQDAPSPLLVLCPAPAVLLLPVPLPQARAHLPRTPPLPWGWCPRPWLPGLPWEGVDQCCGPQPSRWV